MLVFIAIVNTLSDRTETYWKMGPSPVLNEIIR